MPAFDQEFGESLLCLIANINPTIPKIMPGIEESSIPKIPRITPDIPQLLLLPLSINY